MKTKALGLFAFISLSALGLSKWRGYSESPKAISLPATALIRVNASQNTGSKKEPKQSALPIKMTAAVPLTENSYRDDSLLRKETDTLSSRVESLFDDAGEVSSSRQEHMGTYLIVKSVTEDGSRIESGYTDGKILKARSIYKPDGLNGVISYDSQGRVSSLLIHRPGKTLGFVTLFESGLVRRIAIPTEGKVFVREYAEDGTLVESKIVQE